MLFDNVAKLYQFRWLVYELVLRNVRLRYRGSLLGFLWTFLNPVIFVGIYTLVFSVFLKAGIHNFALFVLAGMVPFTSFSSSVQQGTTSILDGRAYVGKTLFPAIVLTVVPVLTNAVNLALSLPLVVIVALLCHVHVGFNLLLLPVIFVLQLLLTQAVTTLFATINVFFRDLQELIGYALSALFFLTPIIYDASRIPLRFQPLLTLNPLTPIVEGYQAVLYSGTFPNLARLGYTAVFTAITLLIANALFLRYREMFSEYV